MISPNSISPGLGLVVRPHHAASGLGSLLSCTARNGAPEAQAVSGALPGRLPFQPGAARRQPCGAGITRIASPSTWLSSSALVVVLESRATLVTAVVVWLLWRVVVWQRRGGDPIRELVVAGLFVWCLVIVRLTFFPLRIIFYDWHGTSNLIPFASILQLLRDTPGAFAFDNIVGNFLLFVPLGFLLPLLFQRLRRPWPLIWRAAVISVGIEVTQIVTRARASDIDDVLINTAGAAGGFALFSVVAALAGRLEPGRALLERLGDRSGREPFRAALVPVVVTALIAVPLLASTVVKETLGGGSSGIIGHALAAWPNGTLVARANVNEYTVLVVGDRAREPERLLRYDYERVLPWRYTWVSGPSELPASGGSHYSWSISAYNTARDETPTVVVWGTNRVNARTMEVSGNGVSETLNLPEGEVFVVGFAFDVDAQPATDVLEDFGFRFRDASGEDVTERFTGPSG